MSNRIDTQSTNCISRGLTAGAGVGLSGLPSPLLSLSSLGASRCERLSACSRSSGEKGASVLERTRSVPGGCEEPDFTDCERRCMEAERRPWAEEDLRGSWVVWRERERPTDEMVSLG